MDYIEDRIREKIADEIRYLELPPEWRPNHVIQYIVSKIERRNNYEYPQKD
jgi:hypothetical protein